MRRSMLMLAVLAGTACSCNPQTTSSRAPTTTTEDAIIEIRSTQTGPVELFVRPVLGYSAALPGDMPSSSSSRPRRFASFPVRVRCRLNTACNVYFRHPEQVMVTVPAFEPLVVVELGEHIAPHARSAVHVDAKSTSAAVSAVHRAAVDLFEACRAEPRRPLPTELLERWRSDARKVVRDAAVLAWLTEECDEDSSAEPLARDVLNEVKRRSPALNLWPRGFARASTLAPDIGESRLITVAEGHPEPERGANMLADAYWFASKEGDTILAEKLLQRLRAPPFDETLIRGSIERTIRWDNRFLVDVGEPLPRLRGSRIDTGDEIDTDALRGQPLLLYLTSLSCGSCKINLPVLRSFAADHPTVRILVITLDEAPGAARRLARDHAPIPGVIVDNDPQVRRDVTQNLMSPHVYPSFLLVDADGSVLARSVDLRLEELDELPQLESREKSR